MTSDDKQEGSGNTTKLAKSNKDGRVEKDSIDRCAHAYLSARASFKSDNRCRDTGGNLTEIKTDYLFKNKNKPYSSLP